MSTCESTTTYTSFKTKLAQFKCVRTLGEGTFGDVSLYESKDNRDIIFAIKTMDLSKHENKIKDIKREAALMKLVANHPNIICWYRNMIDENNFYIFMEYAHGGELFDRITPDVGMPIDDARRYFIQLLSGLKHLHILGICHRDIKPENLLLTMEDTLKIADFGFATLFKNKQKERQLDTKCGSLPYVAPEVFTGRYNGPDVDIWSSGMVLIAMLVGQLPWESPEMSDVKYKAYCENQAFNKKPWNQLKTKTLNLLRGILEPVPNKRYTMDRILKHPWLKPNDTYVIESFAETEKRTRLSEPCTQPSEMHSYRQRKKSMENSVDENSENGINPRLHSNLSFSQPGDLNSLLLVKSQRDPSQASLRYPMQNMVKRMTRFCVTVTINDVENVLTYYCKELDFFIKRRSQDKISREIVFTSENQTNNQTFIVTLFELQNDRVMVDIRRSRGDGLEFKRIFDKIRANLSEIICEKSYNWLVENGLVFANNDNSTPIEVQLSQKMKV